LVLKEEQVKVTISLSKKSVDFFKTVARQNHTSYQKMIRRVIDLYSTNYDNRA
jgi:predicted DNA binding CopG/RHH family protein